MKSDEIRERPGEGEEHNSTSREGSEEHEIVRRHENRLDLSRPFEQLTKEQMETRDKKSEIIEGMVTKDFPVTAEKRLDNSKDFHYLHNERFNEELKYRDPSSSEAEIKYTNGFYDSRDGQAYVREDGNTLETSIHEKLHQKSMSELPTRFNEGLTEHFAREESGPTGRLIDIDERGRKIESAGSDYENETRIAGQVEALIGREPLKEAYFEGNREELRSRLDSVLGDGSFSRITDALERRDYKTASDVLLKRKD